MSGRRVSLIYGGIAFSAAVAGLSSLVAGAGAASLLFAGAAAVIGGVAGWLLADFLRRRALGDLETAVRALAALADGAAPKPLYLEPQEAGGVDSRFNQELQRLSDKISALELDRARFLAIIANLSSGIVLLDRRRRVQMVNPAAERIFGVWAPEVEQTYHLAITHAYALEGALDRVERGEILDIERREGGRILQIHLAPVPGAGGTLLVATDVTEERRLLEVRSQFVANVSHELRTPLTVIGGFAETLLSEELDDKRRTRFLRHIMDETRRLSLLVDDLLRLSAIEGGRERPARSRIPLMELCRAVAERYGDTAATRGIALQVEGESVSVFSDRDRIEGIVISLLDNAVKYTQDDGRIAVAARREDGRVVLTVGDNGPGIPPQDLPHVFERFYRVDRSRQRTTGGSGLGLAIARHLALSIGAELRVESTLGEGSCFTLEIPDIPGPVDA